MAWPTPQDYNEAIQNPALCFNEADLKAGKIECNALGLPKSASGAFASVFKLTTAEGPWAIRCFLRFLPEQTNRYQKISQFVLFDDLECTVDFHYIDKGILVRGNWYPILKMRWVHGDTLDLYVQKHFKDQEKMAKLSTDFFDLVMQLENADIAHGDLQHGNILVTAEGLRLVDYDALFVPALAGLTCLEFGHPNYQHPLRSPNQFDPTVDNFSTWLIHASLLAIKIDPSLFSTFIGGDESILFKRKDLLSPETSLLFKAIIEHESDEIRNTAQILMRMLWASPSLVPPLNATAYDLSALPNIQPYHEPAQEGADKPVSTFGMFFDQGDADLGSVIRTTVKRDDQKPGIFQYRKRKFRFKATAAGLSKRAHANAIKLVDATFRKSAPVSWTSIKLREGDKHYDLKQYEEAVKVFTYIQSQREAFLQENCNELIELQLRLGRTFGMMNNLNMACNYFLIASKTAESNDKHFQIQRARFLLAVARFQAGRQDDAFTIIDSLTALSINLEELITREARFGYVRNSGTLRLIESYSKKYAEKGNLKESIDVLEIGRAFSSHLANPASREFRESYLDLLLRLGCNYKRLGFFSYANGVTVQMERLIAEDETTGYYKLRVYLYATCVLVWMSNSYKLHPSLSRLAKLHPSLSRLAKTLRSENGDTIEAAVKSFYIELGVKEVLAVVATAASYLNDNNVRKDAIALARLAWQMLSRDFDGSPVEKVRWLKNLEPSLLLHCLDEATTREIVSHVRKDLKDNKAIDATDVILATLHSIGKSAEPTTIAVLDEMIRVIRKYDYAFSTGQINKAKMLIQQYDLSRTRIGKLDDIDGLKKP